MTKFSRALWLSIVASTFLLAAVSSCNKPNDIANSATGTESTSSKAFADSKSKKDDDGCPPVISDTLVSTSLLSAHKWPLQLLRAVVGNLNIVYIQGGSSNTMDFTGDYYDFQANGNGYYNAPGGAQTPFTWSFDDSTYRNLTMNIQYSPTLAVHWYNMYYKGGSLYYSEYYTQGANYESAGAQRLAQ